MGQAKDPAGELERALRAAREAGLKDPDAAEIAADDAGGTRLAEALAEDDEGEAQAHPS